MNVKPLGDRVVVKVLKTEEKTKSGIVLPDIRRNPRRERLLRLVPDVCWTTVRKLTWK